MVSLKAACFFLPNLSEGCCGVEGCKLLRSVSANKNPQILLNLTWLYQSLQNILQNRVEADLASHQSIPESSPKLSLTWFCTNPPTPSPVFFLRNLLRNTVEPGAAQSIPDSLRNPADFDPIPSHTPCFYTTYLTQ